MNQEESKLKPLASELESPFSAASTTGRDQQSSTTLRHRHHPFEQRHFSPQRYSSTDTRQSFVLPLTDIHRPMEPSQTQAPPAGLPVRKESMASPSDLSVGSSTSPHLPFHAHRPFDPSLLSAMPEDEGTFDEDNELDREMDVDESVYSKAPLENQGPSAIGDNAKGQSPKNFVFKLFQMLADPEAAAYIVWSAQGSEFIVTNQEEFAKKILSKHFKHSNFSSFVRQLNMYDFHKTNRAPRSQRGAPQPQIWVFSHARFIRGRPDLLSGIKRKANEGSTAPIPYGEDQLLSERRSSFPAVLRSPPNGAATNQEAAIRDLQMRNEDLSQRLQQMERDYRKLATTVQTILDTIRSQGPPQQLLDPEEAVRAGMVAHTPTQPDAHVRHLDCNVPESIGPVSNFQQDGLTSTPTDSQSPVDHFRSAGPTGSFVSSSSTSGSSGMRRSSSSNPLHDASLPMSTTLGIPGGSSGYPPVHHQSNPVSQQNYVFQGIGSFNIYDPGSQQVAGHPGHGQNFPSAVPQILPTNQNRINLGGRGHPVMMTPAKSGPPAAIPSKGQPPDSTGGLYSR